MSKSTQRSKKLYLQPDLPGDDSDHPFYHNALYFPCSGGGRNGNTKLYQFRGPVFCYTGGAGNSFLWAEGDRKTQR